MSVVKSNALQLGQSVTATNNFTWYQPATPDGTVRLGNGNSGSVTDLVAVNSSGNVGIGTSSPGSKLDVKSSGNTPIRLQTTGGSDVYLQFTNTTGGAYIGSSGDGLGFYTSGSATLRATLDSSGNLGLGVTPSAWDSAYRALQIPYGALAGNSSGTSIRLVGNAYVGSGGSTYLTTGAATTYLQYQGAHQWFTAPSGTAGNAISFTQAMTLDASGNLLVGVTSSTASPAKGFVATSSGNAQIAVGHDTGALSGYYYASFAYNGSVIGNISQNGTTAVVYNTSSDQRLKTNIAPAGSAIQSILDFPVDQFDWISTGEHQDFGAVAQKAYEVIPEMVSVPANEDEMWGIDWSKAVPRLIKTIQEMHKEIQELKQKVNA